MDPERKRRLSVLYHAALAHAPEERARFLKTACADDERLREEVASLLQYEPAARSFLETPAAAVIVGGARAKPMALPHEFGPYTLIALLGSGGMGEVYRARDTKLGREVAIKILPAHFTADVERRARFAREARLLATLNHPHIGAIYGLHEENGTAALVLELVEGSTLAGRLERGPLPIADALTIVLQIADALETAHEKGIIHRDLKPANVMLQGGGGVTSSDLRAKILDFGLAKGTVADFPDDAIATAAFNGTVEGRIFGTPAYMSPEQARGLPVDKRTDIWGFGCILYEMLTGKRLFSGDTIPDVVTAVLTAAPDWRALPSETPQRVRVLLARCLQKDPKLRLRDIGDARLELAPMDEAALGPPQSSATVARPTRTLRLPYAAALTALLVVIGLGGWWAVRTIREQAAHALRQPTPRGVTRLTFDPGLQSEITWSPDGRSIAYASDQKGNFDIWIQPVDGGPARQLTTSPAHDRQPSWSPDGNMIVFRSDRAGGGLYVIPARGGPEHQITSFGVEPKWSRDGSQILFASFDAYALYVPQMFTVRLDGQPPQQVLQPFLRNLRYVVSWNWYPDSKRISLLGATKYGGEGLGIYTVSLSGTDPVVLNYTPEVGSWGGFAWSPSGRSVYIDCNSHGAHAVCKLEVDPSTMTIRATQRLSAGAESRATPVLSRDGKRLAYTMAKGTVRLWTFPFDSRNGRVMGGGQPIDEGDLSVGTSSLSQDGTRVAYEADRVGVAKAELWMTDLTTGKRQQLTGDDNDQVRITPQWSRDGSMLAYGWSERADQKSRQALAIRRMDNHEEQLISTPQAVAGWAVAPYDWSPDGRWILASSVLPHPPVHSLTLWPLAAAPRAETAMRTVAYDPELDLWQARYSPDGKWICFVAEERQVTEGSTIFVMPSSGAERSQWMPLTNSRDWADKPRWSPDGRLVFFVRYRNSFFNLWGIRFDGGTGKAVGEPFQITRFESPTRQISTDLPGADIGVSANRLILTIMEQAGNIWVLDNVDQ